MNLHVFKTILNHVRDRDEVDGLMVHYQGELYRINRLVCTDTTSTPSSPPEQAVPRILCLGDHTEKSNQAVEV